MKDEKKAPKLRFKGFTDDWEERKLKDVLDISKTKNKAQQYGKVDVLSVSREVGTVNQIKYQGRSFAGSDLSNYKVVQGGELIYTKSPLKGAPYGIFQVATIKGIISPLYAVYTSTDKAYTPFVATALKNDNIATHYLAPLVTKGAKNTINVTDEGALEGKLQFPSILEQKQIFIFFKQLDDTIALHQRKLDLLKEQKKGYLQKMFPKNGAKVPELRFAGFADEWEERKLSEGTSKIGDGLHGTPNYSDNGDVFFINGNNLVNGKIVITKETKLVAESNQSKDDKLLNMDTILMSINGTIGNLAWYNNERVMLGKSVAYLTVSNFDKKFIFSYLQTSTIKNYFLNNLTGTTIKNLGLKTIRDTTLFVPTLEEQQQIGEFFWILEETIALHQRKLDLLKEQKKGFLQKMFV
ncbi:restriction endonuclease subunit S [Lactobacillus delbrueckii]|uniref:restriction endonuclease subunit S n=1 Tax=Lactobacillus delbrueckii TaxID=1584 RepID=UPI0012E11CFE|nr:restriction endonuclease subunit S [Lactobacillus delbrueckii]QGT60641.1 restriction endonuclease subunit S [Lactobacillus delbrueckii]